MENENFSCWSEAYLASAMLASHGIRGKIGTVRDEAVPVADLVAQVTVLERLDDRRDQLISQLRRTASAGMRPARTSQPVREILLETLADCRWPQNAGFLEEYLLACHQLQLDSRAFAPLRRDERKAWDRA